jgi:hypothetical protein
MLRVEQNGGPTMAHGFVCVNCGWQESAHIHGGFAMTVEQREEMRVLKPGFPLTQIECAQSYEPSDKELAHIRKLREQGGSHEGQH